MVLLHVQRVTYKHRPQQYQWTGDSAGKVKRLPMTTNTELDARHSTTPNRRQATAHDSLRNMQRFDPHGYAKLFEIKTYQGKPVERWFNHVFETSADSTQLQTYTTGFLTAEDFINKEARYAVKVHPEILRQAAQVQLKSKHQCTTMAATLLHAVITGFQYNNELNVADMSKLTATVHTNIASIQGCLPPEFILQKSDNKEGVGLLVGKLPGEQVLHCAVYCKYNEEVHTYDTQECNMESPIYLQLRYTGHPRQHNFQALVDQTKQKPTKSSEAIRDSNRSSSHGCREDQYGRLNLQYRRPIEQFRISERHITRLTKEERAAMENIPLHKIKAYNLYMQGSYYANRYYLHRKVEGMPTYICSVNQEDAKELVKDKLFMTFQKLKAKKNLEDYYELTKGGQTQTKYILIPSDSKYWADISDDYLTITKDRKGGFCKIITHDCFATVDISEEEAKEYESTTVPATCTKYNNAEHAKYTSKGQLSLIDRTDVRINYQPQQCDELAIRGMANAVPISTMLPTTDSGIMYDNSADAASRHYIATYVPSTSTTVSYTDTINLKERHEQIKTNLKAQGTHIFAPFNNYLCEMWRDYSMRQHTRDCYDKLSDTICESDQYAGAFATGLLPCNLEDAASIPSGPDGFKSGLYHQYNMTCRRFNQDDVSYNRVAQTILRKVPPCHECVEKISQFLHQCKCPRTLHKERECTKPQAKAISTYIKEKKTRRFIKPSDISHHYHHEYYGSPSIEIYNRYIDIRHTDETRAFAELFELPCHGRGKPRKTTVKDGPIGDAEQAQLAKQQGASQYALQLGKDIRQFNLQNAPQEAIICIHHFFGQCKNEKCTMPHPEKPTHLQRLYGLASKIPETCPEWMNGTCPYEKSLKSRACIFHHYDLPDIDWITEDLLHSIVPLTPRWGNGGDFEPREGTYDYYEWQFDEGQESGNWAPENSPAREKDFQSYMPEGWFDDEIEQYNQPEHQDLQDQDSSHQDDYDAEFEQFLNEMEQEPTNQCTGSYDYEADEQITEPEDECEDVKQEATNISQLRSTTFVAGQGLPIDFQCAITNCQDAVRHCDATPTLLKVNHSCITILPAAFVAVINVEGHYAIVTSQSATCPINNKEYKTFTQAQIEALYVPKATSSSTGSNVSLASDPVVPAKCKSFSPTPSMVLSEASSATSGSDLDTHVTATRVYGFSCDTDETPGYYEEDGFHEYDSENRGWYVRGDYIFRARKVIFTMPTFDFTTAIPAELTDVAACIYEREVVSDIDGTMTIRAIINDVPPDNLVVSMYNADKVTANCIYLSAYRNQMAAKKGGVTIKSFMDFHFSDEKYAIYNRTPTDFVDYDEKIAMFALFELRNKLVNCTFHLGSNLHDTGKNIRYSNPTPLDGMDFTHKSNIEELKARKKVGNKLGAGNYGSVYEHPYDPTKVRKHSVLPIVEHEVQMMKVAATKKIGPTPRKIKRYPDCGMALLDMDKIQGDNIYTYIDNHELTKEDKTKILASVYHQMRALDIMGICHADTHPGNIIINTDCIPTIIDFGLAWKYNSGPSFTKKRASCVNAIFYQSLLNELVNNTYEQQIPETYIEKMCLYSMSTVFRPYRWNPFPRGVEGDISRGKYENIHKTVSMPQVVTYPHSKFEITKIEEMPKETQPKQQLQKAQEKQLSPVACHAVTEITKPNIQTAITTQLPQLQRVVLLERPKVSYKEQLHQKSKVTTQQETTSQQLSIRGTPDNWELQLQLRSELSTTSESIQLAPKALLPPPAKLKPEDLFPKLQFQKKQCNIKRLPNFCFVHAAAPAWKLLGKYLTHSSQTELAELTATQQADATELLAATGIPEVITVECPHHGTVELTNQCCNLREPVNGQFILSRTITKTTKICNQLLEPEVHLHYIGDGASGHWTATVLKPTVKYHDNGQILAQRKAKPIVATVLRVTNQFFTTVTALPITQLQGFVIIPTTAPTDIQKSLEEQGFTKQTDTTFANDKFTVLICKPAEVKKFHIKTATIHIPTNTGTKFLQTGFTFDTKINCKSDTDYIALKSGQYTAPAQSPLQSPVQQQNTSVKSADQKFKNKVNTGKQPQVNKNIRRACNEVFKLLEKGPIVDIGCGIGKGFNAYGNIPTSLLGLDILEEVLSNNATTLPYPATFKVFDCSKNYHDHIRQFDQVVSQFALHFCMLPPHENRQIHVVPFYNKQTYSQWSQQATVEVISKTEESITHKLTMDSIETTETLITKEAWQAAYNCSHIQLTTLSDYSKSPNEHLKNFLVIIHEPHYNHDDIPITTEDESEFESLPTSTLPSSDTSEPKSPAIEISQNIILTIHTTDSSYERIQNNIHVRMAGAGSHFCRMDNCVKCTYNLEPSELNSQLISNMALFTSASGTTKNILSKEFFKTLHQRKVVYTYDDKASEPTDSNWLIIQTETTNTVAVLHSVKLTGPLQSEFGLIHYDYSAPTAQDICKRLPHQVILYMDAADAKKAIEEIKQVYQPRITTFGCTVEGYQRLDAKPKMNILTTLFRNREDYWKCTVGQTTDVTESTNDRATFVLNFIHKHRLHNYERLDTPKVTYFFPRSKVDNALPATTDAFYYTHTPVTKETSIMAIMGVYKHNGGVNVFTKIITPKGCKYYENGQEKDIKAGKDFDSTIKDNYQGATRTGDLSITYFADKVEKPNYIYFAPLVLFLLNPGIFSLLLSLTFAFFMLTKPETSKKFFKQIYTFLNTLTEAASVNLTTHIRFIQLQTLTAIVRTICYSSLAIATYNIYASLSANTDIIDTTKPSYHTITQAILSYLGLIPSLDQYRNTITLGQLCGANPVCRFGRPINKIYLDEYSAYVNTFMTPNKVGSIISFFFYATPWTFWLIFTNLPVSSSIAFYNAAIIGATAMYYGRRLLRCCSRKGPFCPRHATSRNHAVGIQVDGKVYSIPFTKVTFCKEHNYWCNARHTHLMPAPIARIIEEQLNIKRGAISTDRHVSFTNAKQVSQLPEEFKNFKHDQVYSISHLSYQVWNLRTALFAYQSGQVVKLQAYTNTDYNTDQVAMSAPVKAFFQNLNSWTRSYVDDIPISTTNNLHYGFLQHLTDSERERFDAFCLQFNHAYTMTIIDNDTFLQGKLPVELSVADITTYTRYHQDTILLDYFPVKHHEEICAQAAEHGYRTKQAASKRSVSYKVIVIVLLTCLALALLRVGFMKAKKINTPAGLNPTTKDYAHGQLYFHDDIYGADAVTLHANSPHQAWLFPNGTFAFTAYKYTTPQRSSCGDFPTGRYGGQRELSCGRFFPSYFTLASITLYTMKAGVDYITPHGSYYAEDAAVCFGYSQGLFCHVSASAVSTTSFIALTTAFVAVLISTIYFFLRLRYVFGIYTKDILTLCAIHAASVIGYFFNPFLPIPIFTAAMFIPDLNLYLFWPYVICTGSIVFGFNLMLVLSSQVIIFGLYMLFAKSDSAVQYTSSGLIFGTDITKIAQSVFSIAPDTIYKVCTATGKTMKDMLTLSHGSSSNPTTHLANALLKAHLSNTTVLYEPSQTKLYSVLQSIRKRAGDIVTNPVCTYNLCHIAEADTTTIDNIGIGFFISPTEVLTARHCDCGDNTRVIYKGKTLEILSKVERGFNIIFTVAPQDVMQVQVDEHHTLAQGVAYTHYTIHDGNTALHQVVPTPSGHFAFAETFAGESGSPIFLNSTLIGIHQGMMPAVNAQPCHAIPTRVDGSPYDPHFHDILKSVGPITYDGNTIFRAITKASPKAIIPHHEFLTLIRNFNAKLPSTITPVDDPAILEGAAFNCDKECMAFIDQPIVTKEIYQAYTVSNYQVKLQANKKTIVLTKLTFTNVFTILSLIFHLLSNATDLTGDILLQSLLSVLTLFITFRTTLPVFTVMSSHLFLQKLQSFLLLVLVNFSQFDKVTTVNELIATTRYQLYDFMLLAVILFFACTKTLLLPVRQLVFTVTFWLAAKLFGLELIDALSIFIYAYISPGSAFTAFSVMMLRTQYAFQWTVLVCILCLRINYTQTFINIFASITSDTIITPKLYFIDYYASHGKAPSYWEAVFSNFFYAHSHGCVKFTPQATIQMYQLVGQNVNTPNITAKSKALMGKPDNEQLVGQFVQAIEAVLQSSNPEARQQFAEWLNAQHNIQTITEWINANKKDNPSKEERKMMNCANARIEYLAAKERKLVKQLEALQQEQVLGLVRCEQALKISTLLNKAVESLQDQAALKTRKFTEGIYAASTISIPETVVFTTPATKQYLFKDDETGAYVFELDEKLHFLEHLKDNEGDDVTGEIDKLKPSQFPLTGRLLQPELQANIGYTEDILAYDIIRADNGDVTEIRHTHKGHPIFKAVDKDTEDRAAVYLPVDGKLKPFTAIRNVKPAVLDAIITRLATSHAELQRATIKIGGLPNVSDHQAYSDIPTRCEGFVTYYGPSLCKSCQYKIQHDCKVGCFVQVPKIRAIEDPVAFLTVNQPCEHNKFVCNECTPNFEAQARHAGNAKQMYLQRRQQAKN